MGSGWVRGWVWAGIRVLGVQSRATLGDEPLVIWPRDCDEARALVSDSGQRVGLGRGRVRVRGRGRGKVRVRVRVRVSEVGLDRVSEVGLDKVCSSCE